MRSIGRIALARTVLMCGAAGTVFMAGQAYAQASTSNPSDSPNAAAEAASADTDEKTADIVVTGTSIRGVAPVGAPVLALTQAEIQLQPTTTTTELLRNVPAVIGTGANEAYGGSANNSNANITGGNGINLRGLGTEATLTLLNGRRLPPAGVQGQYFDPSVFATSAIGRLEVMPDGGSAVYGSDAVGGVVNIMTRRGFDGAEAYVRQGFNEDVQSIQAGAVIGRKWNGGSAMLAYEFLDRGDLKASDRALYTDDLRGFGGTDLRLFTASPGNIQIGSTRYPIPAGQNGSALTPGQLLPASASNPANRESVYRGTSAVPGQRRHSVIGTIRQEIAPGIELWTEGFYAHRQLDQTIGAVTANLSVPSTNGYFVAPAGAVLPACPVSAGVPLGTRCETVNYSFYNDFGPRVRDAFQEVWQVAVGFDAKLGGSWSLSGYGSHGRDTEERTQYSLNNAQLAIALRDPNRATAFNPFGAGSFTNPATLTRILGSSFVGTKSDLTDFVLKLDGTLVTLPGGDLKVAVGAEYQRHKFRYNTLDNVATPDTSTFSEVLAVPKRSVKSVYSELFVPLVGSGNAIPGVQELSLSAALRYDKYSDFGSTTNPKLAMRYVPVKGLTLRGTYGKSYRAPTLSDINPATVVVTVEDFVDPTSPTGLTHTMFLRGGNSNLGPERATIWSAGADFEPSFLPALSLSLTYFNVDYRDRIEAPGNDRTALTAARAPLLGNLITRNPSVALVQSFLNTPQYTGAPENPANILAIVDGRKVNVGRLKTSGIEGVAQYSTGVGFGRVNAGVSGTYVFNFKRSVLPTLPLVDVADTFGNPVKFRLRGNLGLTSGGFSGNIFVNHSGGYRNDTVTPVQRVGSYTTVDLGLRYTVNSRATLAKDITFSIDVQNLLDRAPPIVPNPTPLAYDPQVASLVGRFFTVGVRARW